LGTTAPHRLRIAVLLDHLNSFSGGYEAQLRDAIHAKCREAGHHLLLVYGGPVEAPQPLDAADNAIYELLRPDSVDGIIVVSSLLSTYCGPTGVARLVERLGPATLCSIGIELPGVPSLVLDNRPGMEAVVEHLIRDTAVASWRSSRARRRTRRRRSGSTLIRPCSRATASPAIRR
jgi:phosphoserine phosphatase RsbU/P